MSDASVINLVHLISSLVLLALSIPLILEKIGPNGLYGFRTAKTRSDPKIWYAVNKATGKGLAIAAGVILLSTIGVFLCGQLDTAQVALINLAVTVVAIGGAVGYGVSVLRKM
jgi:membrane-associated PAP2 superfamily phosphatase